MKSDSKCFVFYKACALLTKGYISKQIYFCGIIINENIHTAFYNVFATHCYVLEEEKNLTNAL